MLTFQNKVLMFADLNLTSEKLNVFFQGTNAEEEERDPDGSGRKVEDDGRAVAASIRWTPSWANDYDRFSVLEPSAAPSDV